MAGVPPPIKPPITPATPSSVPPPPEKLADAPFDNPRADLVLRSSDEVHFRVLKGILSIASTVFADMFGIPPPPSDRQDEIQVVPVSEDSTALDVVLRHLYPVRTPKGDILLYASILAEFARKYQVDVLDEFIPSYLKDSVERDPVGVYAIAATYEYKSIGANAARLCLNLPFSGLNSPYLRCTTTELELLKYHVKCGQVTSAVASSSRKWVSSLAQTGQTSKPIIVNRRTEACGSCGMQDVMPQTEHGAPLLYDYNSQDDDEKFIRYTIRSTVSMELLMSCRPHSCAAPNCSNSYNGAFYTEVQ